jgi:para-nitrobenzyl esterase
VVPLDVEEAFASGQAAAVPLIIGTNSAEFWWMKPSDLTAYGALDDGLTPEHREALLDAYGGQAGYDAHLVSDLVFNEPARRLARLHARNGQPTFLYRFDVVAEAMNEPHEGATHASERPYVFDTLETSSWPTEARDQAAADQMAGYWTEFAKAGDPNGGERVRWPDLRSEPDQLLEFTNDGPVVRPVPYKARLDLIERLYPAR